MTRVRLVVDLTVVDEQLLVDYARKRYAVCWGDENWQPRDVAEATYEAMIASNENPEPSAIGLNIEGEVAGATIIDEHGDEVV